MKIFEFFNGKFSLSINGVAFLIFSVLAIAAVGYLLGRVTIKGVNLGTAGVFLIALLYGCLFYKYLDAQLVVNGEFEKNIEYTTNALKIVENLGLMLFVTSVGFIAGPKFFGNLKKNFKTFILLGLVIIVSGALVCAGCLVLAKLTMKDIPAIELKAIMTGLFSGALTSTPAFSAAKEAIGSDYASYVAVGNGIAYIFGVIGVVLFVQLVPKFLKADMAVERAKLTGGDANAEDPVERMSSRPDVCALCYGVNSLDFEYHKGTRKNFVGQTLTDEDEIDAFCKKYSGVNSIKEDTPPTFLWHTAEDKSVPVSNSVNLATALWKNSIPCELHVYPYGGHGKGLCKGKYELPLAHTWFGQMVSFMKYHFDKNLSEE